MSEASKLLAAKILLTLSAIQFGFVPPFVDFTESHVFHPEWPPHARFHLVWLLASGALFAAYVIGAIWFSRSSSAIRQASIVGCIVLVAFFAATLSLSQYGGSLTDLEEPIHVFGIDGNVFSFALAALLQFVGTLMVWRAPRTNET